MPAELEAHRTHRATNPSTNPKKRADANFQFQIYSDIDRINTIETSPDPVTWTSLTNILITNVLMDFIDWGASNFPSRFYRAVQP